MNVIEAAIEKAGGPAVVGKACGVTYQAVLKWTKSGTLPRTEWTGETNYSAVIEKLTKGKFSREKLLSTRVA